MSATHRASTVVRFGLNPTTGRPWTLADAQVKTEVGAELASMNSGLAVARLRSLGILTPTGRLPKKYGGR